MMQLPGGMVTHDGAVERHGRTREIDGRLELELWEASAAGGDRVACIDRVIGAAMNFDGLPVRAADLATGDRQFIMAELTRRFASGPFWRTVSCSGCGELYDICIDLDRLPVTPAGSNYPQTTATISSGEVEIRVPSGADQAAVAQIDDEMQAVTELAQRCIVTPGRYLADDADTLDADLASIDAALQHVAPQVATSVASRCPDCGADNASAFDTAALFFEHVADPLPEFHAVAMAYHWSEKDLLSLPRRRRHAYLALIDTEIGTLR